MTDTALATATVVWRARAVGQDTDDPGNAPQEYPLAGVKVRLVPSPRKIEVAAPPGGVAPTTFTLRTWDLVIREDGSLVSPEAGDGGGEAAGVQIVASDAIPGVTIEWTSTISAPDTGVPDITKSWLAPTGETVDLTTVASVGPSPSPLADYLQAVADARAARDIAAALATQVREAAQAAQLAASITVQATLGGRPGTLILTYPALAAGPYPNTVRVPIGA